MNVMFTVQGDGRGHMTQAIALKEMLEQSGHQVVAVLAGQNQSRTLPSFFTEAFQVPVEPFPSPGFTLKQGKAISTVRSVMHFFGNVRAYWRSLAAIQSAIDRTQPDLMVNFLEPLAGYFNLRRRPKVPVLSVAHHFMFEHPRYPKVHKFGLQTLSMRFYVRLTGANASRLALSFYHGEDLPARRLLRVSADLEPAVVRAAAGSQREALPGLFVESRLRDGDRSLAPASIRRCRFIVFTTNPERRPRSGARRT